MIRRSAVCALALVVGAGPLAPRAQEDFFASRTVLAVTLTTDLRQLLRDRDPDNAPWRDATLEYRDAAGARTVPLRIRTRGIYRLANCAFPPIRLRFRDADARGTPFENLRRPKLVTHCEDKDAYEQYLLQEYAAYRVLNLLTSVSFRARLLRVTYVDSAGGMDPVTRYAFITEDPERLAERLGGKILEQQGAELEHVDHAQAAVVGVFQYFIGNTDWSVPGLHNIALVQTPDTVYTVPYDFDWSGVVDPPYAKPSEKLPIKSVRERIYRGFCQPWVELEPVLVRFEALRDTIAALYRAVPGLDPERVRRTLDYYKEFYDAITDRPRFMQRVVIRDCPS